MQYILSQSVVATMYFRTGDISVLQVDAVVNSTNETMDDNSPMCQRIFAQAGSALKTEIFNEIKGVGLTQELFVFCTSSYFQIRTNKRIEKR